MATGRGHKIGTTQSPPARALSPEAHRGPRRSRDISWSQDFTNITAHDSSRFHAGNSYVENEFNYYGVLTPQDPSARTQSMSLQTALAFPEMSLRSNNIAREHSETCNWILETQGYKRWRDSSFLECHHGVLWIKGKPGAGKSTMLKYLLKHHEVTANNGLLVSFFFKARGEGLERTVEGMYRALLYELIKNCLPLQEKVEMNVREFYKKRGWPLELLKELFREAVLYNTRTSDLTCYIDALDECEEDDVRDMLASFEAVAREAISLGLRFLVCFTSRHYPNITIDHREEIIIDDMEGHHDDISLYVQHRFKLYSSHQRSALAKEISQRSSGIFLWVVIVVSILNRASDSGNIHQLRDRLLTIPTSLRELFDDILVRDETTENLVAVAQWTLFAARPLTAAEFHYIVLLGTGQLPAEAKEWDTESFDGRALHAFMLTSSKGFLEPRSTSLSSKVSSQDNSALQRSDRPSSSPGPELPSSSASPDTDSIYEFIHESAREYFLEQGLKRLDPTLGDDIAAASHERLAQICTRVVELQPAGRLFQNYIRDYGAVYHANQAGRRSLPQEQFCVSFPFKEILPIPRTMSSRPTQLPTYTTFLQAVVDREYEALVQADLAHRAKCKQASFKTYIDSEWNGFGTALHIAVHRNNTTIIGHLLSSGVDFNVRNQHQSTALDCALSREYHDCIRLLLGYATNHGVLSGSDIARIVATQIRESRGSVVHAIAESGLLEKLPLGDLLAILTVAVRFAHGHNRIALQSLLRCMPLAVFESPQYEKMMLFDISDLAGLRKNKRRLKQAKARRTR